MYTFVTSTSYGSWLPGDTRGWSSNGRTLPPNPRLEQISRRTLQSSPIKFSTVDQDCLLRAICAAAIEFHYHLTDLAIETWHLHWIIHHEDPIDSMVGRLKSRMRQSLHRGRIWTAGYCARRLISDQALYQTRQYIKAHPGCRISHGQLLSTPAPQS